MASNDNQPNFRHQMKFVVYGLFEIEPETLRRAFNDENLYPVRIVKMIMKRRINDELQNYLLYFNCSPNVEQDTKNYFRVLQRVRSVYGVKVKWAVYVNRRTGPLQCMRCLQYGHGDRGCTNTAICFRCSEEHDSRACKYFMPNSRMIPNDKVKCFFCQGGHTALSIECQVRKDIIDEFNSNACNEEENDSDESETSDDQTSEETESNSDSEEEEETETNNAVANSKLKLSSELKEMINLKRNIRKRWQRTFDRRYKTVLNRLQKEIKEQLVKLRENL